MPGGAPGGAFSSVVDTETFLACIGPPGADGPAGASELGKMLLFTSVLKAGDVLPGGTFFRTLGPNGEAGGSFVGALFSIGPSIFLPVVLSFTPAISLSVRPNPGAAAFPANTTGGLRIGAPVAMKSLNSTMQNYVYKKGGRTDTS